METLAIIAYKQPVSKTDVENIRGVNCDYAVQKLLDKGLIEIRGKADTIGRPMLYGTSPKFMEYFGINDITDLPTPKDFTAEVNTIGEVPEN
jgi:segregation and condensation protein B